MGGESVMIIGIGLLMIGGCMGALLAVFFFAAWYNENKEDN